MATFKTQLRKDDAVNATGIEIPADIIDSFGKGKKPPVTITINGFTYRTTVAVMNKKFMVPLSQARRAEAKVQSGDVIDVTVELDTEPRTVEVPDDLAAALAAKPGAREAFDKTSPSGRKEFVRQVEDAKTQETRDRRIAAIVAKLG